MKLRPVQNHPEIKWRLLTMIGPVEDRLKVIIVKDRGVWTYRYKRPGEHNYIFIGPVQHFPTSSKLRQEIELIDLVSDIY